MPSPELSSLAVLTAAPVYNLKVGSPADGRISTTYSNNVKLVRDADGAIRTPGNALTFKVEGIVTVTPGDPGYA